MSIPSTTMDPSKKRKAEENGTSSSVENPSPATAITADDLRKILLPFTQDQLLDILQTAAVNHPDVLDGVRLIADRDTTQRKLFVRGLGFETTTDRIREVFSAYGELEEAIVIVDRTTGKSKGYGFVTFRHTDSAVLALKEPSKKVDGRITVTQLASLGNAAGSMGQGDVANRKIYVGSVPAEMAAERLLALFAAYGEIEEGPLGFDKHTGKARGFAFFVYKTEEGAKASLENPIKNIDGYQLVCKLAVDNKKNKLGSMPNAGGGVPSQVAVSGESSGDKMGVQSQPSFTGSQYGAPGGHLSYGGYSGTPMGNYSTAHPSSMAAGGSSYGGNMGVSSYGGSQFGVGGPVEYGGLSSAYRMPPSSAGVGAGGYSENSHYGLSSSSSSFPTQLHQASSMPGGPPGGLYPNLPPYY